MLRAAALVLSPLVCVLWLRPADACTCPQVNAIEHPSGATISAGDGLIGRTVSVATPTVSVTYVDDPAQARIPGTLEVMAGQISGVWTFVPSAPLAVGRTVRAVVQPVGQSSPVTSREFEVVSATVAAPLGFAGVTGMRAILSRLYDPAPELCGIGPEQSRVVLEGITRPSAAAPLYRYFFYRQGTPPPARPFYGVAGRYISEVRCGEHAVRCEPDLYMRFQAGETWCVRVEAADLMGNRAGYDREACAIVEVEDVEVSRYGGLVSCLPRAADPDGGVASPDSGAPPADSGHAADAVAVVPDSGPTGVVADAGAGSRDASASPGAEDEDDGCTCVRPNDGSGHLGVISALLAALAVVALRKRRSPGR